MTRHHFGHQTDFLIQNINFDSLEHSSVGRLLYFVFRITCSAPLFSDDSL